MKSGGMVTAIMTLFKRGTTKPVPKLAPTRVFREHLKYHENKIREIEPKEGKLPDNDSRRKPNYSIVLNIHMLEHLKKKAERCVKSMRVNPIVKKPVLIPLFTKAIEEQYLNREKKVSSLDICITIDSKGIKKVEGQEPAETWLRQTCSKKMPWVIGKEKNDEKRAKINEIVGLFKFKGNEIYLNKNATVAFSNQYPEITGQAGKAAFAMKPEQKKINHSNSLKEMKYQRPKSESIAN